MLNAEYQQFYFLNVNESNSKEWRKRIGEIKPIHNFSLNYKKMQFTLMSKIEWSFRGFFYWNSIMKSENIFLRCKIVFMWKMNEFVLMQIPLVWVAHKFHMFHTHNFTTIKFDFNKNKIQSSFHIVSTLSNVFPCEFKWFLMPNRIYIIFKSEIFFGNMYFIKREKNKVKVRSVRFFLCCSLSFNKITGFTEKKWNGWRPSRCPSGKFSLHRVELKFRIIRPQRRHRHRKHRLYVFQQQDLTR